MTRLAQWEGYARALARGLALIGFVGLLAMALGITADVLLRWLFSSPIHGLEDVNGILIGIVVISFFPALLVDRGNVTLEFAGQALGPRVSDWLDAFAHLITLALMTLIAWQLFGHAAEISAQETLILRLPTAPGWWLTAALAAVCVPVQVIVFLVHLARALRGPDAAAQG